MRCICTDVVIQCMFVGCVQDGRTPLHYASWTNSLEISKLLISHGANIHEKKSDLN